MAFELLNTNLSGLAIIDQPGGVIATQDNFIDIYTYAEKYMPELVPKLFMANGRGRINWLLKLIGAESNYASDQIQWAEEGRLQNKLTDVTVAGNVFTSTTNHNLRIGDTILVSDGTVEAQATVTAITSLLVFTATNDAGGAFAFSGAVDVICDFSNSWQKGTENFKVGRRWNPNPIVNYSHILKEVYETNESDMVHKSWIDTPEGIKWFNHEIERTNSLFDNKVELTQIFHNRKASGDAKGVIGVVPQVEERGNIGNEYLAVIGDLSAIAKRAKQQGTCREFTIFHNHDQGAYLREMLSGVNAHYATGANYGLFQNKMDMALYLGFKSIYIDGVTFHFTPWALLDDPTIMGGAKFSATNLACLIVPSGNTFVQENGNTVSRPYLSYRYRSQPGQSRKKIIKIFGHGGQQQSKDAQTTEFTSEFTNQLAGANSYFVVRAGDFYS